MNHKIHLIAGLFGIVLAVIGAVLAGFEIGPYATATNAQMNIMYGMIVMLTIASFCNLSVWSYKTFVSPHFKAMADRNLAHAICHDEPEVLEHLGIQDPPEEQKQEGYYYCPACGARNNKHNDWCPIWD